MPNLALADELAEIRAEIARLRLREAAIRAHVLRQPDQVATGRWTRVEVVQREEWRLIPDRLPEAIRQDPAYLERRVVTALRCLPAPASLGNRPGWPIQRDWAHLH